MKDNILRKTKKCLYILFLVAIVLGFSTWLILLSQGYKINWAARKIQETGTIYLKSNPKNVNILLNNKLISKKTPCKISELLPGRYDVEISLPNFQSWKKNFNVESGLVNVDENIILFYQNPKVANPTQQEIDKFNTNNILSSLLKISENEIWYEDQLVTRVSAKVESAFLYFDSFHIVYQSNNQLRIIGLDGSNDVKIADLNTNKPIKIFSTSKALFFSDGEQINKLIVQES